jgi:protein-S-isoprenylcysteine O-methyltransferase Ste14
MGVQVLTTIAVFAFVWFWPGAWNTQRFIGAGLLVVGMLFVFIARFQLGRSFSVTAQARQLVTHGLYSRIRNPIYVFGTIAIAGLCLILRKPAMWFFLLAIVVIQTVRARKEARVLESKFGDDYRSYRSRTWF